MFEIPHPDIAKPHWTVVILEPDGKPVRVRRIRGSTPVPRRPGEHDGILHQHTVMHHGLLNPPPAPITRRMVAVGARQSLVNLRI